LDVLYIVSIKTAEEIANEYKFFNIFEYLKQMRLNAPLQLAYFENKKNNNDLDLNVKKILQIWIGDNKALDIKYCADEAIKITHIIYIKKENNFLKHTVWLQKNIFDDQKNKHNINNNVTNNIGDNDNKTNFNNTINTTTNNNNNNENKQENTKFNEIINDEPPTFFSKILYELEDDDITDESFLVFNENLPELLSYLFEIINTSETNRVSILICDDTGVSTSPALLSVLLLLKYQIRISETIKSCEKLRSSCNICKSLRRGLEKIQKTLDEKKIKRLNNKLHDTTVLSTNF